MRKSGTYYDRHRDLILQRYAALSPEAKAEYSAKQRQRRIKNTAHYSWLNHWHNAARRNLNTSFTEESYLVFIQRPCRYCGLTPALGIDRIENGEGYTPDNSAPCCKVCNYAKSDLSAAEFESWLNRVVNHQVKAA